MKPNSNKIFIKEMFPDLDENTIERLLESTVNNVDLVVTKILDGTYKGIQFNIKDIRYNRIKQPVFKKDLYYPELVKNYSSIKEEIDVETNRKEIKRLNMKINTLRHKGSSHKIRQVSEYYSDIISELKSDVNKLNKECTLCVLKKTLKDPGCLDLHGLYTLDALKFVDDYIRIYEPEKLKLITGNEDSSLSMRPSLKKFLIDKKYTVTDEGPCLIARRGN